MTQLANSEPVAVPKSIAAKTMAVYRSDSADALVLVTLLAPWEHMQAIRSASFTFHVPADYIAEVVTMQPVQVLCANHLTRGDEYKPTNGRLGSRVLVQVEADGEPFPVGLRYTSEWGTSAVVIGETNEPIAIEAFGRICPR